MNTRDKRFAHAVLGDGCDVSPLASSVLPAGSFQLRSFREWPFGTAKGMRSLVVEAPTVSGDAGEKEAAGSFVVVASHGGGLAATEVQVGLDLRLRGVDTGRVWGKSEHLLGELVSPETAPATRHTVQVDFHE